VLLPEELGQAATDSPELAGLPRVIIPEFFVYSVRLCDGGHLLPRALLTLNLAAGFPDVSLVPSLAGLLRRTVTVDLFGQPPQRERIREEVVRLASQHPDWSQDRIGANLSERVEQPVVQKALALQHLMEKLGLSSPDVIVREPPNDYPKLRRHKPARPQLERHSRTGFRSGSAIGRPALSHPSLRADRSISAAIVRVECPLVHFGQLTRLRLPRCPPSPIFAASAAARFPGAGSWPSAEWQWSASRWPKRPPSHRLRNAAVPAQSSWS
jgi:hypothetical protein